MKTLTTYIKLGAALAMAALLSACPSKSSSNSSNYSGTPVGYGGAVPGCPTCTMGQGTLFEAPAYYSNMSMTLRVYGDVNQITQIQYMGQSPAKIYSGQAGMVGAMTVAQNSYVGACVLVAGNYQMTAISGGNYQMGSFGFSQVQLTNGQYQYQAQVQGVIVDADANGIPEGFGAQLYILQGPSSYGGITACNDPIGFTLAP